MRHLKADIAIIGGGAAGLSIAAGAAQMGARVVLFESGQMGGDCLNTGCVPSKTLLAEAAAREVEARLTPETAYRDAMQEVARVISAISPHDSAERFESLGVTVINQHARFDGMRHLVSADYSVRFKRAVIATGAEPAIPDIPGLEQIPYLTTDTLWSHGSHPRRLMIIGAGPVGIELALAHQKLGASVVLVEQAQLAPQLPTAAGDCIRTMLTEAGVRVLEGWEPERVNVHEGAINVAFRSQPAIEVDTLLLASGRTPCTDGLNLESAGVQCTGGRIETNVRMQTSNRSIYALGDVTTRGGLTHLASHHASIVLRHALFRIPARVDQAIVPRVIYSHPEIAHAGMTEAELTARPDAGGLRRLHVPMADNDRAMTESSVDGGIWVVATKRGEVLSVTIVSEGAGDLIMPWVLLMQQGGKLSTMAGLVFPYPTRGELSKRVAGQFYQAKLFSKPMRLLVQILCRLLP